MPPNRREAHVRSHQWCFREGIPIETIKYRRLMGENAAIKLTGTFGFLKVDVC